MWPSRVIDDLPDLTPALLDITGLDRTEVVNVEVNLDDYDLPHPGGHTTVLAANPTTELRTIKKLDQLNPQDWPPGQSDQVFWNHVMAGAGALVRLTYDIDFQPTGVHKLAAGVTIREMLRTVVRHSTLHQNTSTFVGERPDPQKYIEDHRPSYEIMRPYMRGRLRFLIAPTFGD